MWCLGFPALARERGQEALALAQTLDHPLSLAFAQYFVAYLHYRRRDALTVQALAEALLTLATTQGFPLYVGWEHACGAGPRHTGPEHGGPGADTPGHGSLIGHGADADGAALYDAAGRGGGGTGQVAEGLYWLAEARTALEACGRGDMLAEAYRLQGELLLRQAAPDAVQAEVCFQQALAIARHQQAKSWELRAALSLSRLWQQQGKQVEAHALLAPVHAWFTEGLDTADLQEARPCWQTWHKRRLGFFQVLYAVPAAILHRVLRLRSAVRLEHGLGPG